MSEKSTLRLMVLGILIASLLITVVSRLFFLQVVSSDVYTAQAASNRVHTVETQAARGLILDQVGRPLVSNRTSLIVSVDRQALRAQEDHGKAVIDRLAPALGMTPTMLSYRLEPCGKDAHAKPPICWNGSPYQPIPVAKDISQDLALKIMERRSDYAGVVASLEAVRVYPSPFNVNAAHLLGYVGPVSDSELADQKALIDAGKLDPNGPRLRRTDLVGRGGLESQYDKQLRGVEGIKRVSVNLRGSVTGTVSQTTPVAGQDLVTNIDAKLQEVAETQLKAAIDRARATKDPNGTGNYRADSGAVVVMDVTNGHVLAMASYPSYDPSQFVGGISTKEYEALTTASANLPLISRATQGQFAPASTFKIVTASAALQNGYNPSDQFDCPSSYQVGNRVFKNFESHEYGQLSLTKGLAVSCDTMWYQVAYKWWLEAGGNNPGAHPKDPVEEMSKAYGIGRRTGIDLPAESRGRVGGREFKTLQNKQLHDSWCARSRDGYPEVAKTDPHRATLLQAYAADACANGGLFRGGDAVNMAIGQGDTVVTPLQMAVAYSALANGGTIWQPQIAKGFMRSDGHVVKTIAPKKVGSLPVSQANLEFLRSAFSEVTSQSFGTGYPPFQGFPLNQIPIAAKTGTGQAGSNKQSTSWFATFAPANKPKYAVVMMVSQGGTGSKTSAPSVRKIYEAIYGIRGSSIDPARSVLFGGEPTQTFPKVTVNGEPIYPEYRDSRTTSGGGATAPSGQSPSGSPSSGLVVVPLAAGWLANKRHGRRSRTSTRSRGGTT